MELPTVCIVNPAAKSGFTRINETDFDPNAHTLFDVATGSPVPQVGVEVVEIPLAWASLHWKTRVALAEKLAGGDLSPADGQTVTETADAVIAAEVARRSA